MDDVNFLYDVIVDVRNFDRYTNYYQQYLTIEVQKIADYLNIDQRHISYAIFDEANLQKFQDFIGECTDFNLGILTIDEALNLAKQLSPARTIKNKVWITKTLSDYFINQQGLLEHTIS